MDYSTCLRRIEKAIDFKSKDEVIVIFYDTKSAEGYQPQPNDFIIIADYGEGYHDHTSPTQNY